MKRHHIAEYSPLPGFDILKDAKENTFTEILDERSFSPHHAYDAYHKIHKVFVGEAGGRQLEIIASSLKGEWLPRYLNVAGWASAEAALVQEERSTVHRMALVDQAEACWERALRGQEQLSQSETHQWAHEDSASYRFALNLAFTPLMKALIAGSVTETTLERTFADTLAIAEAAAIQRNLANKDGYNEAVGDLLGFGHECNALLTLLYMNDPRHIPLPSTARAGAGYEYRDQTHDIVVINQHWGNILKVVPVEIKARASLRDHIRYKALIVRGKMHLSIEGKYLPEHTLNAFARMYDGSNDQSDEMTVLHATSTMKELLQLYQQGRRLHPERRGATPTHFYEKKIS
ncbi:MAG TPA: hypothetical protein VFT59_05485 [Candidatus Saccharimonadales bacterium]|nr:hypothetical protein [Candidatus Saccharimonadales bacterium]